jgi:beta,beta-carotene 9',10'-dioxygenase
MQQTPLDSVDRPDRRRPRAAARGGLDRIPFRWTRRDATSLPVTVTGALPEWLRGQLVRTAPAVLETGAYRARHWFDGLALVYGFSLGERVEFRQQPLACASAADVADARPARAQFSTPTRRGLLSRLFKPVPDITDNTNVNIVPWQGAWLAMTEGPYQHVIGADDLASRGLYEYEDELPSGLGMTAHPHFDFARDALVNVGVFYGAKSKLMVYRQGAGDHKRVVEGTLALPRMPYVHSFGLTPRHALIVHHPWTVNPARMLFSNRGFIDNFRWQPEHGTELWKLERETGRWTSYQTHALFCFHTVHAFDDGDDVVLDMLVYDDPSIVARLETAALSQALPTIAPRLVRARLSPGQSQARLEPLSERRFEFPSISYRRSQGLPTRVVWGTTLDASHADEWETALIRVDVERSAALRHHEADMTYGEPVFVGKPGGQADEGVLLAVGNHAREEQSTLLVLDATTMDPLAHCSVPLSLPLGFHGSFAATPPAGPPRP